MSIKLALTLHLFILINFLSSQFYVIPYLLYKFFLLSLFCWIVAGQFAQSALQSFSQSFKISIKCNTYLPTYCLASTFHVMRHFKRGKNLVDNVSWTLIKLNHFVYGETELVVPDAKFNGIKIANVDNLLSPAKQVAKGTLWFMVVALATRAPCDSEMKMQLGIMITLIHRI